ncbi:hypothetical protein B0H11DRAFT_2215240 [Mycena galericulata]|nr:hypothetical protein B0H11DRAFT_2215240 [Mycena galericulata]
MRKKSRKVTRANFSENGNKQWSETIGSDPTTKDQVLPDCVIEFLKGVERFRTARKPPTHPAAAALLANASASHDKASSHKRARSTSIGPSDVESEVEEDGDEDIVMVDAASSKGKSKIPPINVLSDGESEVEDKVTPAKKKVKKATAPAASSSKKASTSGPNNELDILSYDEMLAHIDNARRIGATNKNVPTSDDGLRRMDCALRTQLAQLAIAINVESRKYDAVYIEYERVRRTMDDRKVTSAEFVPLTDPIEYPAVRPVHIPSGPRASFSCNTRANSGFVRGRGRAN